MFIHINEKSICNIKAPNAAQNENTRIFVRANFWASNFRLKQKPAVTGHKA